MNPVKNILLTLLLGGLLQAASLPALAAPDRLQKVMASHELRVCIWPDYYGITYRNPKTRSLTGLDIDIANAFAAELGVKPRFIDSSFSQLVDNLENDLCDIAMHGISITPERSAHLVFTQPYLRSDIYAIATRRGTQVRNWSDLDQPGRVIAVQAGTFMEPIMQQSLKKARLLVVKPPATREAEVESGRADAFMTDYPYSQRMLDLSDWAVLIAPPQPFHKSDYAFALAPGDRSLLEPANQFLTTIRRDGRLALYAARYKLEPILLSTENAK
jgi:ABC-type amino acid transport substrate-binding protein